MIIDIEEVIRGPSIEEIITGHGQEEEDFEDEEDWDE